MESNNVILVSQKLEIIGILKEAVKVFAKNYENFISFWPITLEIVEKFDKEYSDQLVQLGLLYLLPLHLLELSSVLVIVDLASKIYRKEESWMTFKNMVQRPGHGRTLKGIFVTFLYMTFLSTCSLLGLIWFYLEWSATWNMSLVVSILEGLYGVETLALSCYFNRGNERRGLILMLVFFVFGVSLRFPCLFFGCFGSERWIVAQIGLFCLGNALKWVACAVNFHNCKNRIMGKKVDEEVGEKVEAVDGRKVDEAGEKVEAADENARST